MLCFAPAPLPDIPGVPVLRVGEDTDHAGHVRRGYDAAPGALIVVHPDGHLGLVSTDTSRVPDYRATIGAANLAVR